MRRLGYFIHTTSSGKILVKLTTPKPPKLGTRVYDRYRRFIGRVIDVIGPVRSPYAIVKPSREVELRRYDVLFSK